jgi:predicted nucleotidyltransferase
MFFSGDMRELIEIFEKHGVEYVLIGGFAVNFYGYVRTTQDIDLLIYPSLENAEAVMAALLEFGFGGAGIPKECFEREGSAVHLGVEPNRIDLLTCIQGVENSRIFKNMKRVELGSVEVNIISLEDLIESKQSSDRARDRADAEELLKTVKKKL